MADMTFAQALTEARQIIVQQSSRIKNDLEKIKALQQQVLDSTTAVAERNRQLTDQQTTLAQRDSQVADLSAKLTDATTAREQADAIIDRQGQRLTQMQATLVGLEGQLSEQTEKAISLGQELETIRQQLPTHEDQEALSALSDLLVNKKVTVPAAGRSLTPTMRIAPEPRDGQQAVAA